MTLTTRLTAAMVALVLLTAAAVGYLSYRNVEAGMLPTELERVETRARQLASELEAYVRSARADVIAFRSAVALEGLVRASQAGGTDPDSGLSAAQWGERFAARFAAELAAKPSYANFRVIGTADNGREILRVDRSGANDTIRIVPAAELQHQGDRDYFRQAVRLRLGEVYVSPIDLNQEHGAIEVPYRPVIRVAAPVHAPDGRIFGIITINVDLRPAFDLIRSATRPGRRTFVVNERGDYLVHPDPTREFGFEFGTPARWQDEFPEFAAALGPAQRGVHIVKELTGERAGIALASARLAEGPRVAVIGTVPYAELVAPAAAVGRSTFIVGLVAVIAAMWLAVPLARTLTRPIVQMTAAVEAFGRGEPMAVPTDAKGEVGVLARAFARMAAEVRDAHAELTMEIAERRRLFDTSLDLIIVGDSRGNFLRVSPSSLAIVGYRPEELVGRSGVDVLYPGDLENIRQEMRLTRHGREMRNFECRYVHKDGRIVTLAWTGVWSEPERVYFFIGRDMTESKKAEEALLDSERVARGIVDSALDAFIQMDEAGRITEWNPQAQALFGWSREEAVGQFLGTLIVPPQYRERHAAGLDRFLRTHEGKILGQRFEIEALRRDGSEFKVEVAVTALRRRGGYVFNAFIRDLTEKIAAEAQLRQSQKMDAVGQLTGGVAHDFNNILTVITGTIEILEEGVAGRPNLAALAHMIDEAATRGADLTRQLLAFARKQPLEPRDTDVNTLIIDTAKLLRPTLGEQIEIESMLGDDVWHTLIDPSQLSSAIVNLAVNARDAMPEAAS